MMLRRLLILSSCALLRTLPLEADAGYRWRIEPVGEIARPNVPGSASMGGIAWVSNNVYWAVTDWNPVVWKLELPVDLRSGRLSGCSLTRMCEPQDAVDVEAIVRDPTDGSVWVADECSCRITRHDPATGRRTGQVELPPMMDGIHKDLGLESLTISEDGLVMWTCTEESLKADGPRSTKAHGSDVRLTKLCRKGVADRWKVAGQWVYLTDSIAGGPWSIKGGDASRSGVSELCLLEDGTLLVLEREFSKVIIPRLRCRIYEVDFTSATDVANVESIKQVSGLERVGKRLLFETKGLSMYEGMCVGPKLADGSRLLVLVSDGDNRTLCTVFSLRLYRL